MPAAKGFDRNQMQFSSLDSMVAPNSSARLIDAFVNALECAKAGVGEPARTGRPSYDRMALIKLCLYGYVNDIRSSRKFARECLVNIEAKWLVNGIAPDFRTISSFLKDNAALLQKVFYEFNLRINGEVQWGFKPAAGTKILEVGLNANTLSYEERSARVKTLKGRMDVYLASLSDGGSKKKTAAANLLSGMSEEDIAAKAVEAKEMIAFYEGVYEDCRKKLKKH